MKFFLFYALIVFLFIQNWEAYGESPGSIKWSILLGNPGTPFLSSPAIGPGGTIFAAYYDNIGAYSGKLYAINSNGTEKWNLPIMVARRTHPAVDSNGNIYVGSRDEFIYSINPDGVINWTYRSGDGSPTSPGIGKDGTIYIGGDRLIALNPNGILRWYYSPSRGWNPYVNTPTAISPDGTIYAGIHGKSYSHNLGVKSTFDL